MKNEWIDHGTILLHWRHIIVWVILVDTGSGNGLLPHDTKWLPKPVLTYHQYGPIRDLKMPISKIRFKISFFKNAFRSPIEKWANHDNILYRAEMAKLVLM